MRVAEDFALTDANAPLVGEICRRLDGLPLAIEFAASRVEVLRVGSLAARLDDGLPLLGARHRRAIPRHQTMRAVLDWSYGLLSEDEQRFFRALGIFAGVFTAEAAAAIAMDAAPAGTDAIDRLADLVAKSLVIADVSDTKPRFRLLDTTRAYAIEKLDAGGEREPIARRHAEYCRDLFVRAEGEWETRPTSEWLASYACEIANLHVALDWSFSPEGDQALGLSLTAAAIPLWMHLSMIKECRVRSERALAADTTAGPEQARRRMKLSAAIGTAMFLTEGAGARETGATWREVFEIAGSVGDTEYQLRALWGLWAFDVNSGRYRNAPELAKRFRILASQRSDLNDRLVGARMAGASQFFLGNLATAGDELQYFLDEYVTPARRSDVIRYQFEMRVPARVFLAWILWLRGLPDRARKTVEAAVEQAWAANHPASLCYALALGACPLELLAGDLAAAERCANTLLDQSARDVPPLWHAVARSHRGVLAVLRGNADAGLVLRRDSLDEVGDGGFALRIVSSLGLWAATIARAGKVQRSSSRSTVRSGTRRRLEKAGYRRVSAPQGRASVAGRARRRGGGRGSLPASARLGAASGDTKGCSVLA